MGSTEPVYVFMGRKGHVKGNNRIQQNYILTLNLGLLARYVRKS